MTKIRAHCPTCGDVEFGVEAIVVLASPEPSARDSLMDDRFTGTYRFLCPLCHTAVRRSALPEVIDLLVTAGVAVDLGTGTKTAQADRGGQTRTATAKGTRGDRRTRRDGGGSPQAPAAPFSDADVAAFRSVLAQSDWFDRLQASGD